MACPISASLRSGISQMALAASKFTISLLSRSHSSSSFIIGLRRLGSSSASFAARRTNITRAAGDFTTPAALYCCTILTSAMRSCERI